ncbi:MAG: methylmalonyl-CoA mutase family protein, partial [Chitinophagales bacterium]
MSNLFKDFSPTSTSEWQTKIETDLKGKPFDNLKINLGNQKINPYHRTEDLATIDHSDLVKYGNAGWQVGEVFKVENIKETNKKVLNALMNGVDAPTFYFEKNISDEDFLNLFENIGVEHITTYFSIGENVDEENLHNQWIALLATKQVSTTASFFPKQNIDCTVFFDEENAIKELQQCKNTFSLDKTHFTLFVGKNYLQEIAKLRAFQLLWLDFLKDEGEKPFLPNISVQFSPTAYGNDKHDNLINASTLAMSAILGGASQIIVRPTGNSDTERRHARNVQLILKHESGFDQVTDPAQGSYQIEKMTAILVNEV